MSSPSSPVSPSSSLSLHGVAIWCADKYLDCNPKKIAGATDYQIEGIREAVIIRTKMAIKNFGNIAAIVAIVLAILPGVSFLMALVAAGLFLLVSDVADRELQKHLMQAHPDAQTAQANKRVLTGIPEYSAQDLFSGLGLGQAPKDYEVVGFRIGKFVLWYNFLPIPDKNNMPAQAPKQAVSGGRGRDSTPGTQAVSSHSRSSSSMAPVSTGYARVPLPPRTRKGAATTNEVADDNESPSSSSSSSTVAPMYPQRHEMPPLSSTTNHS